jgi:hypothetical protein
MTNLEDIVGRDCPSVRRHVARKLSKGEAGRPAGRVKRDP